VTVVIPAFNRAELLPRALASLDAQRPWRPAEVIVVDDASTDGTAEVAARLGARVLRHETNRGPAEARNTAFAAAAQPWLAQLDSDDEWLPHCLATLWALRSGHVLVCGGSLALLPGGGRRYNGTMRRRPEVITSPARLVFPDNFVASSGVLLSTAAVRAVGGYRPGGRFAEDLDLWIRLLENGTGIATPTVVTRYHVHEAQATQAQAALLGGHRDVLASYEGRPWWRPSLLRRWSAVPAWAAVKDAAASGSRLEALAALARLVADPQRARGLAELLLFRLRARRRSARLSRPRA
jgi:glycosyltransferase involved in cell wall biosynthesis